MPVFTLFRLSHWDYPEFTLETPNFEKGVPKGRRARIHYNSKKVVILKHGTANYPYDWQKLIGHVIFIPFIGSSNGGKPTLHTAAATCCRRAEPEARRLTRGARSSRIPPANPYKQPPGSGSHLLNHAKSYFKQMNLGGGPKPWHLYTHKQLGR